VIEFLFIFNFPRVGLLLPGLLLPTLLQIFLLPSFLLLFLPSLLCLLDGCFPN
jgi:hypothetical protein